jgi:hypothetical protein
VEGSSDRIFYERFTDKSTCEVIDVPGKPSSKLRVIAVLKILEESGFNGILAIVDADFDRLTSLSHYSSNLFYTDTHDLETMLINSPAFDKVTSEFCSEEKVLKFNQDIKSTVLESGVSIGYLLWFSQREELNLTFHSIVFSKFIDEYTLQVDELKLVREVKNKSKAFSLRDEDLLIVLKDSRDSKYDSWQVCCGHDLIEILSLGLRKAIGSNKHSDVEASSLERYLRLAYEEGYFLKTQLYTDVRAWEGDNQPFKVLRSDL